MSARDMRIPDPQVQRLLELRRTNHSDFTKEAIYYVLDVLAAYNESEDDGEVWSLEKLAAWCRTEVRIINRASEFYPDQTAEPILVQARRYEAIARVLEGRIE